jgi:hypothetical protein
MPSRKNWPLFGSVGVALLGVIIFLGFLRWDGLSFTVKLENLTSLLAPIAFAATVIERAVEILVSPWRDAEANKLEKAVAAIKARPASSDATQNAVDLKTASDALDEYRGDTQRYAFAVSLTLSVLVSIAGVRSLGPFVDATKLKDVNPAQHLFFLGIDVTLSAALLAGGADGIHSVVNAITSFFNATADKAKA